MRKLICSLLILVNIPIGGFCQTNGDCLPEYRFDGKKLILTEKEWKERLTPEQFKVLRKGGTEPAFHNEYAANKGEGIYECAGCALPLYSSAAKYDSGTGWPSFWQPIAKQNVHELTDRMFGMTRTEVRCAECDAHLGHVFDDGPKPTGLRYCMNTVAMRFIPYIKS